jgi:hypothetical protein
MKEMKDLREEVAKSIMAEGQFDMTEFGWINELTDKKLIWLRNALKFATGTPCCIAGHIVAVAHRLGLIPEGITDTYKNYDVDGLARDVWRHEYGDEEAERLQFTETGWGDLENVTPQEAINHINGAPPVVHNEH